MANGDLYQVTDVAYNNDQQNLNVYFYKRDSVVVTGDDAEALAENFNTNMMPVIKAMQNTSVLHTEIRVRNLYNASDAFTKLISTAGTYANADEAPIFTAVNVTLSHDNPAIRKGRKAIGGLDEQQMSNGIISASGMITALGNYCEKVADALQEGIIDTWFPVIVKRILTGGVYGLPDDVGSTVLGGITAAIYDALVTTQNSRKTGHGV